MSESEGKRVRRSAEERAAEIDTKVEALRQSITDQETKKQEAVAAFDEKIASIRERIKAMEAKKKEILAPKQPRKRRKSNKSCRRLCSRRRNPVLSRRRLRSFWESSWKNKSAFKKRDWNRIFHLAPTAFLS